ncbi:unnamed protein product [Cuscuta europaea]|uniref:Uncharacterized protein n=1 Tax=Cuscuta europaea TaxID=41803 RepID=A0A9P0ZEW3_CUSEU|nr:unnamed protein product [Cuscuta europaea]
MDADFPLPSSRLVPIWLVVASLENLLQEISGCFFLENLNTPRWNSSLELASAINGCLGALLTFQTSFEGEQLGMRWNIRCIPSLFGRRMEVD